MTPQTPELVTVEGKERITDAASLAFRQFQQDDTTPEPACTRVAGACDGVPCVDASVRGRRECSEPVWILIHVRSEYPAGLGKRAKRQCCDDRR